MNEKPQHIAVIMDGNGRWARQRGLARSKGHLAGVDAVRELVRSCRAENIPYVTVYAFSKENWQRPEAIICVALLTMPISTMKQSLEAVRKWLISSATLLQYSNALSLTLQITRLAATIFWAMPTNI